MGTLHSIRNESFLLCFRTDCRRRHNVEDYICTKYESCSLIFSFVVTFSGRLNVLNIKYDKNNTYK